MGEFGSISTILAIIAGVFFGTNAAAAENTDADVTTIVLFGDSIAAGYGLPPEDGLTSKLEARLKASSPQIVMKAAGVSGDTTAGGLARLDWSVGPDTDVVILVLGGNDALRAIPPSETAANLDALVSGLVDKGVQVLLTGMRAPPNLGSEYAEEFEPIFAAVAKKHGVTFYPFILEGVAADPNLNQADGIHPNAQGVDVIVEGLAPFILQMIEQADAMGAS